MWKLFLDDERFPVEETGWQIARSSNQAIEMVKNNGMPRFISFDHDLGDDDTAMNFIHWIIDELHNRQVSIPNDFEFDVHSQNPIGAENIRFLMNNVVSHFKV